MIVNNHCIRIENALINSAVECRSGCRNMILQQSGNMDVVSQTIGAVECRMLRAVCCEIQIDRVQKYDFAKIRKYGEQEKY